MDWNKAFKTNTSLNWVVVLNARELTAFVSLYVQGYEAQEHHQLKIALSYAVEGHGLWWPAFALELF
jgi:hypothetical protein